MVRRVTTAAPFDKAFSWPPERKASSPDPWRDVRVWSGRHRTLDNAADRWLRERACDPGPLIFDGRDAGKPDWGRPGVRVYYDADGREWSYYPTGEPHWESEEFVARDIVSESARPEWFGAGDAPDAPEDTGHWGSASEAFAQDGDHSAPSVDPAARGGGRGWADERHKALLCGCEIMEGHARTGKRGRPRSTHLGRGCHHEGEGHDTPAASTRLGRRIGQTGIWHGLYPRSSSPWAPCHGEPQPFGLFAALKVPCDEAGIVDSIPGARATLERRR